MNEFRHYLNTDLDLLSDHNLDSLLDEVAPDIFLLHKECTNGLYKARLEIELDSETAEQTIVQFCNILEKLSPVGMDLWKSCSKKIFNIGIDTQPDSGTFEAGLSHKTLKRVVDLGANIEWTVYSFKDC